MVIVRMVQEGKGKTAEGGGETLAWKEKQKQRTI